MAPKPKVFRSKLTTLTSPNDDDQPNAAWSPQPWAAEDGGSIPFSVVLPSKQSQHLDSMKAEQKYCPICNLFFNTVQRFEGHKLEAHKDFEYNVSQLDVIRCEREEKQRKLKARRELCRKEVERLREEHRIEEERQQVKAEKKRQKKVKQKKRKEKQTKRQGKMERKMTESQPVGNQVKKEFRGLSKESIALVMHFRSNPAKYCNACNIRFTSPELHQAHATEYHKLGLRHAPVFAYPRRTWFSRLKKARELLAKAEEMYTEDGKLAGSAQTLSTGHQGLRLPITGLSRMERKRRQREKGTWAR